MKQDKRPKTLRVKSSSHAVDSLKLTVGDEELIVDSFEIKRIDSQSNIIIATIELPVIFGDQKEF